MGIIVYANLANFLLDEGAKTIDQMVKEANEMFGFPEERTRSEFEIILGMAQNNDQIKLIGDVYIKLKPLRNPEEFLNMFKNTPEGYSNQHPDLFKLLQAMKEKYK